MHDNASTSTSTGSLIQKRCFVEQLRPKDRVQTALLIRQVELLTSRDGKSYLSMLLSDKTGTVESRMWNDADIWFTRLTEGMFVSVSGKVNLHQNRLQLSLETLAPLASEDLDLDDFLPKSQEDLPALYNELISVFENLEDPWVKRLGLSLLQDPEISSRFGRAPAAKSIHHAFVGGLLSHSMQLVRLTDAVAPLYPEADRSILVFGAVFHDFGKIFELSYERGFEYTDEGKLVGHIPIGTIILDQHIRAIEGFPSQLEYQLKHILLSHHGRLEYGSPKVPQTIEAEIVHLLDTLDSRMESILTFIKSDKGSGRWTSMHKAFQRSYYKPDKFVGANRRDDLN